MDLNRYIEIREYLKEVLKGSDLLEKTYCVGGCVRDYIRGSEIKDIDLVVEEQGGGLRLSKYLYTHGHLKYPPVVYENFGTTQFILSRFPEEELEAVQTRSEEYISRKTRNPEVGYGDLSKDWTRRDFTINTLYHSLVSDEILDPSGHGVEDIKSEIIRTTFRADIIFQDDPLRILRAIRFSVTLGYKINQETIIGMRNSISRLEILSIERIVSEITKILMSPSPAYGLSVLKDLGGVWCISKELEETTGMTQNKYHLGTVWEHTLKVLQNLSDAGVRDRITLWAGLLHDIGKLNTKTTGEDGRVHFLGHSEEGGKLGEEMLRSLKFSVADIKCITQLILHHMDFKGILHPKDKKLRKLQYQLGETQYYRLLDLIEADNMAHSPGYCIIGQVDWIKERTKSHGVLFDYKLPISGEDIMKVRGIGPGKLIKGYLDHLMKLVYTNPDLSREELLKRLKNLSPEKLGKEYATTKNNRRN